MGLCARLEATREAIVARQIGGGVARPGGRILDTVLVTPGPGFDERARITDATIPPRLLAADIGPGEPRRPSDVLDVHPERRTDLIERGVEIGYLHRERRDGREFVRATARYPDDWIGGIVGIENKPDLARPGDLDRQLRTDVALGVCDRIVLATASHVTGAHLNRIPEAVGVWRLQDGEVTVVRPAGSLAADAGGVEITAERPGRTDVALVDAAAVCRARRRIAERAYGSGWRPTFPGCKRCAVETVAGASLPDCEYHGRPVEAGRDCGTDCPEYAPTDPPAVDAAAERDAASPWRADPPGTGRRQSGLDRYL
ncbi:hypothetical protein BRD17_07305 [Halobacteriales archaeon SW_7_68_16]|nr:MAG: hypothetical protein BRD17_07305 [Halobacteriales archaeon SW_7_68_16]